MNSSGLCRRTNFSRVRNSTTNVSKNPEPITEPTLFQAGLTARLRKEMAGDQKKWNGVLIERGYFDALPGLRGQAAIFVAIVVEGSASASARSSTFALIGLVR